MNKKAKTGLTLFIILLILLLIAGVVIFLVPIPYTTTEVYTDTEPYVGTEEYQEQVPISVEECKRDVSLNPTDYIKRGIDNIESLLEGDLSKLLETCENVIQMRTVTKTKEVIRYKTVKKERTVTKTATLYMRWTGQVQYRYEV